MLQVDGLGGELFLVSETARFAGEPLEDAGNGFDWRLASPSLRLLEQDPLVEYLDGLVWRAAPVLAVQLVGGHVSLGRCLRWTSVRADGVCRRLIRLGGADSYRLRVELVTHESGVDASGARTFVQHRGEHADCLLAGCRLDDVLAPQLGDRQVLAVLPFQGGCYRGIGRIGQGMPGPDADRQGDRLKVTFDDGEVTYGR